MLCGDDVVDIETRSQRAVRKKERLHRKRRRKLRREKEVREQKVKTKER
jgi:hypothetical protein